MVKLPDNPEHDPKVIRQRIRDAIENLQKNSATAVAACRDFGAAIANLRPDLMKLPHAVQCTACSRWFPMGITVGEFEDWLESDKLVQDAFPDMPAAKRELLISGTCSLCFDQLFSDDD